ncbi:MAG: hypothetical protein P8009_09095 [Gammaproteobacteria bacterium]
MHMGIKLTRVRCGIVTVATIASLTLGLGIAQADVNIPARSKAEMRKAQKQKEAHGGHQIEVICAGKVSTTGSCGGGYWTNVNGIPVYHGGAHGGGSGGGTGGKASARSHTSARHGLFPRRTIRR